MATTMEHELFRSVVTPSGSIGRFLKDNEDNNNDKNAAAKSSYFVDDSGNAYEPYALSWRYLGMYVDCDITQAVRDDDGINRRRRRQLGGGNNNNNNKDSGDDCSRKVLWAAYYDPRYRGHSIGEYQYFDWDTNTWDESTCQTNRCAKMNCHENWNRFKLIGVFKETDGLADWAEQLFKHEGYCLWDGDKDDDNGKNNGNDANDGSDYEFMQTRRESWMGDCRQMYLPDEEGNTLYLDTMPLPGGNMTYGLYIDKSCSEESLMTFPEYVIQYYKTYYYNADRGATAAVYWESIFERWNELMSVYKICQPCRSYNKVVTTKDNGSHDNGNNKDNNGGNNDGGGDEEQYGYNCYDDAGYRNCNQCYKFETKTDMEPASLDDLARASAQGTILSIRVNGTVYGQGTFGSSERDGFQSIYFFTEYIVLGFALGLFALFVVWNFKAAQEQLKRYRRKHAGPSGLKEVLAEPSMEVTQKGSDVTDDTASSSGTQSGFFFHRILKKLQRDKEKETLKSELESKEKSLSRQQELIDQLTFALDMEKTIRDMERQRLQEVINMLKSKEGPPDAAERNSVVDVSNFAGQLYATLSRSFSGGGDGGRSIYRGGDGLMKAAST